MTLRTGKFTLAAKLWSVFGLVAGFFFLVLTLNYLQIDNSLKRTSKLEAQLLPTVLRANQVEIGLYQTLSTLRQFMLTGDPYLKEKRQRIWRDDIFSSLEHIKKIDNNDAIKGIESLLKELKSAQKQLEDIARSADNFPAQKAFASQAAPYAAKLVETFTQLIEVEKKEQTTAARKKILGLLSDVRESIPTVLASLRSYILSGDLRFKEAYLSAITTAKSAFDRLLDEQFSLTPEQFNKIDETVAVMETYLANCDLVAKRREARDWNKANYLLETKAQPLQKELEEKLKIYKENQSNLFNLSFQSQNQALAVSLKREWIILAISIMLFIFIGLQIQRHLLNPIKLLSQAVGQFDPETNPDISFDVTRQNDEVGALAEASESLRQAIVAKIKDIAEQKRALERRVEIRTQELSQKHRDLKSIMDNVKVGIMTVDSGGRIGADYSAYSKELFRSAIEATVSQDLAGQDIFDVLFQNANLGQSLKDQARVALSSVMNAKKVVYTLNKHLLINKLEITAGDDQRFLSLKWDCIIDEDNNIVTGLLLVVSDMTELIELQKQSDQQGVRLRLLDIILDSGIERLRNLLRTEIAMAKRVIDAIVKGGDTISEATLQDIFRELHTIKGNARVNGFVTITDLVHAMESMINRIRMAPESYNANHFMGLAQDIFKELGDYLASIEHYARQLGASGHNLTGEFKKIIKLKGRNPEVIGQQVLAYVRDHDDSTLVGIMNSLVPRINDLADELEKPQPKMTIASLGLSYDSRFQRSLSSMLIHILTNAMDHGIETSSERKLVAKPSQGTINITERLNTAGDAVIEIGDDGRGLDLAKLAQSSPEYAEQQIDAENAAAIGNLIFEQGVSTATHLTTISGRGVGMDAVRNLAVTQNCQIDLCIDKISANKRAKFRLTLTIPANLFEEGFGEQYLDCG